MLTDTTVVFSLDGASGWMLASLSSLLEMPCSQHHMERGCDPMQSPWLLGAPPWKRRAFVKRGGEDVSMTNALAHANSEEDVNEVFTEVLEAMDSNETGEKITLLQSQLPLVQEEPDRRRTRTVLETLLPTNIPAAMSPKGKSLEDCHGGKNEDVLEISKITFENQGTSGLRGFGGFHLHVTQHLAHQHNPYHHFIVCIADTPALGKEGSPCFASFSQHLEEPLLLLAHKHIYLTCTQATEDQIHKSWLQENLCKLLSSSWQEGDPSQTPPSA
ncbi:hypothetical protein llap_11967 [Limosa lapponica baueri]|uniref:Uncharacterized protein n=1 Tax=Limosa lapponica baueri TaxID=1758121 RepID=A0A2I0TVB2_LIMLA|nr:hypothetical protein llap_11967 [Limosa lapponica baueri]